MISCFLLIIIILIELHEYNSYFLTKYIRNNNRILSYINSNINSNNNNNDDDLTAFHNAQWSLYKKYQCGNWIGIQTGYDPDDSTVADYMYTEQNLEYINNDDSIKHTNSIVAGEIRADCEVCYDSERLKSKEIGIYSIGKLKSRVCSNVDLRGPAPTARGLSMELCIRHEDSRMRVLLAHSPIDFQQIENDKCQYAMVLKDIVIVREKLNKRPLKLDDKPDKMWIETPNTSFEGVFGGSRQRFDISGELLTTKISPDKLPICKDPNTELDDHDSYTNDNMYKRVFPGGLMVEAPMIILSGTEARTRITWRPIESQNMV